MAVLIGTRAARLSACGIAAIVSKKGYLEEGCAVGADGSLYNVSLLYQSSRKTRNNTSTSDAMRGKGKRKTVELMSNIEIPKLRQQSSYRPSRHLW